MVRRPRVVRIPKLSAEEVARRERNRVRRRRARELQLLARGVSCLMCADVGHLDCNGEPGWCMCLGFSCDCGKASVYPPTPSRQEGPPDGATHSQGGGRNGDEDPTAEEDA